MHFWTGLSFSWRAFVRSKDNKVNEVRVGTQFLGVLMSHGRVGRKEERKIEIVGFTVTHKGRLSSMCRNAKTGPGKSLRRFQ